jgi:predicted nucleotidyltransferase
LPSPEFCRRWKIVELSLFGSFARGEAGPDSDFDLLVEFNTDAVVGLWDFTRMQDELSDLTGRRVDLVQKGTIKNPFRQASIDRDSVVVFRAA